MQQQGGSHYGSPPPEMAPQFSSPLKIRGGADDLRDQPVTEGVSPISSRSAPQTQTVTCRSPATILDELGGAAAGDGAERGGFAGSRWPRQETVALLKIRSEMDAAFRDATLKSVLWEDVARKMSELGYKRNSKKCKEKFENVHKYYKRTKEGRAGRQDGKSYRFFTQLQALHSTTTTTPSTAAAPTSNSSMAATQLNRAQNPFPQLSTFEPILPPVAARFNFSSTTSSSSSSDFDHDDHSALQDPNRKRKQEEWSFGSKKAMAFFEKLMKQLIQRQDLMQQKFLETIEKREQDRMLREETWKRQEMARLSREYELMAQERTMTANRDAAVISFLQKFAGGGETSVAAPPEALEGQLQIVMNPLAVSSEPAIGGHCVDAVSPEAAKLVPVAKVAPPARWPKAEVLELIRLRSGLEGRCHEAGAKGALWEEISMGMKELGYDRNTKRCKEKWENINKYFKKVKEGKKRRLEDAKTCPYFHELDVLYRKKQQQGISAANSAVVPDFVASEKESNNGENHEHCQGFFGGGSNAEKNGSFTKPGDIVKELMEQHNHEMEDDDDDVDDDEDDYDDDDDDDDDDAEGKLRYEIQFQRQSLGAGGGSHGENVAGSASASVPPSSNGGSFLAMVQ